jgi:ClpP class serine protease
VAHRAATDVERERILKELNIMYDRFVTKVAEAREISVSEVEVLARGRVWTGTQAVELGLVDEIGGLDDAIAIAVEEAGIDNQDYRIVDLGLAGLFDPALFSPIPYAGLLFSRQAELSEEDALAFLTQYDSMYLERMVERAGQPLFMVAPEFMPQHSRAFE